MTNESCWASTASQSTPTFSIFQFDSSIRDCRHQWTLFKSLSTNRSFRSNNYSVHSVLCVRFWYFLFCLLSNGRQTLQSHQRDPQFNHFRTGFFLILYWFDIQYFSSIFFLLLRSFCGTHSSYFPPLRSFFSSPTSNKLLVRLSFLKG